MFDQNLKKPNDTEDILQYDQDTKLYRQEEKVDQHIITQDGDYHKKIQYQQPNFNDFDDFDEQQRSSAKQGNIQDYQQQGKDYLKLYLDDETYEFYKQNQQQVNSPFLENKIEIEEKYGETNNYTKEEEEQEQQDEENQQQNINSHFFFQETEFAGNYNVETNNQSQNLEQYQRFYTQQNYTKQEEGQVQQDDENQQQNMNSYFFFQETEFAGNYNVETNNQAQNLEQYQRFYTQQNYTKQEEGQVQQDDENQQQNINSHFFFQETEFAGNYNVENNNFILIPQQLNEDNSSITLNQYNLSNNNGQLQKRQINLNGKIKNYLEKNNQLQIQNLSPQNQLMLRHLLRDYIESLNPINQKPETQFMCFCSLQYQNKRSLQKHLNNIHRFLPYLWLWHYQFDETQLGQII